MKRYWQDTGLLASLMRPFARRKKRMAAVAS